MHQQQYQRLVSAYECGLTSQLKDSNVGFSRIATPGWSSLVNTKTNTQTSEAGIYSKLCALKHIDLSNKQFLKLAPTKVLSRHQALYLQDRKLSKKKLIARLLHEEQCTFTPSINQNTRRITSEVKREVLREKPTPTTYQMLVAVFALLSNAGEFITLQSIGTAIELLPMPCIRCLDKFVQQLYLGKRYSWGQFLSSFNDGVIAEKKVFEVLMVKWIKRRTN